MLIGVFHYGINLQRVNNIAVADFRNRDFSLALKQFEYLIDQKTKNYILNFNYANTKYKLNSYDDAVLIYESMIKSSKVSNSDKSEAYYNLGNIYFLKEEYGLALENYKKALDFNPNDLDAKYNIQYIVNMLKKLERYRCIFA